MKNRKAYIFKKSGNGTFLYLHNYLGDFEDISSAIATSFFSDVSAFFTHLFTIRLMPQLRGNEE